ILLDTEETVHPNARWMWFDSKKWCQYVTIKEKKTYYWAMISTPYLVRLLSTVGEVISRCFILGGIWYFFDGYILSGLLAFEVLLFMRHYHDPLFLQYIITMPPLRASVKISWSKKYIFESVTSALIVLVRIAESLSIFIMCIICQLHVGLKPQCGHMRRQEAVWYLFLAIVYICVVGFHLYRQLWKSKTRNAFLVKSRTVKQSIYDGNILQIIEYMRYGYRLKNASKFYVCDITYACVHIYMYKYMCMYMYTFI
ncbi:hypothetical protein RFI_13383, partial [Reticulomyxa filosa]